MNVGNLRFAQNKENGDLIIMHQNQNTLSYEIIKKFKAPKSHKKKNKTDKKNNKNKKCTIS